MFPFSPLLPIATILKKERAQDITVYPCFDRAFFFFLTSYPIIPKSTRYKTEYNMGPGEALWPNMNGTYQKKKYFLNHEAMKTQKQCVFAKETLRKKTL